MMSNKRLAVLSLISLIFLAKTIWGQELPSDRWWYSQNLAKKLNLTEAEIRELDQLHLDSHSKLNKLKSAVEDTEFELDNLLGHKSMLDDEVRIQFERLEEARADLANELLRFAVRLREIIGDQRLEQLKSAYEKLR
jgi:septal ring factor EnvC (AmiA/AmiB activator)